MHYLIVIQLNQVLDKELVWVLASAMLYYTYKSYGPWYGEKSIILTCVHQSLFPIQFVPAWYIKSSSII